MFHSCSFTPSESLLPYTVYSLHFYSTYNSSKGELFPSLSASTADPCLIMHHGMGRRIQEVAPVFSIATQRSALRGRRPLLKHKELQGIDQHKQPRRSQPTHMHTHTHAHPRIHTCIQSGVNTGTKCSQLTGSFLWNFFPATKFIS